MVSPQSFSEVLAKLTDVKQSGDIWTAPCPLPGHKTPAGHLTLKDGGDKALITCQGGRHIYSDYCQAWGYGNLTYSHNGNNPNTASQTMKPAEGSKQKTPVKSLTASFSYEYEKGKEAYQIRRFDLSDGNKTFEAWHKDRKYIPGMGEYKGKPILYHLPEIPAWVAADKTIHLPEGEKKVDEIITRGGAATTSPFGAGKNKWHPEFSETLRGANVAILPDKDKPGHEFAQDKARSLYGIAKSVKILELPGLPEKGDIVDWFKIKNNTFELLKQLASAAPEYVPSPHTASILPVIRKYPYTDLGNAERLYYKYGDIFRWVTERRLFIVWNSQAWIYDTADHTQLNKLAKSTVRDIPKEAMPNMSKDDYKALMQFAIECENQNRLKAMIESVKSEGNITISINELNRNPYLFNCRNATIDLHTGMARPHSKDDLITIVAPVDYVFDAKCPKWDSFLNLIQDNNPDMIKYLNKLSGYCLTGDTKTDVIPFCYGIGGNGKSTYWAVQRDYIMGEYAYEVDPDVFLNSGQRFKDSGQREELANLYGKRLVTATEIQKNSQLTINLLKAISGGEAIHGDRKYERGITYKPRFKVILSGNNEPIIKDTSNGAWRRLKKLPFNVTIPNPIDGFEDTFRDELPGILNWLIRGCLLWQSEGLKDPEEVVNATAEYRKNQDIIAQVLDDCFVLEPGVILAKKDFKTVYLNWCTENSVKPVGDKELKQRLIMLNVKDGVNTAGTVRVWKDIRLKTPSDNLTASDGKNLTLSPTKGILEKSYEVPVSSCQTGSNSDSRLENSDILSVQKAIDIWHSEGAPVIHLGPGENCFDLVELLSRSGISAEHLEAVRAWLQGHTK
jgi:putative DNA primase/helicase